MKRTFAVFSLLAIALVFAQAKDKKHPSLPEAFQSAHTVFVESRQGDITDIKLDPEERNAILDTQDAIQDWGRYTLSRSRIDADLIFVVRKGRVWRDQPLTNNPTSNSTGPHLSTGHAPIQDPADASQGPNNTGSPDGLTHEKDELRVYTIDPNGKLKTLLWSGEMDRGLNTPTLFLLQRLKIDVEKAYPTQPAKPQPTP